MADPQTVNIALSVPTRGSDVGVWDTPLNGDFTILDGLIGGVQPISAAGNSPIVLTSPAGFTPVPSGGPTQAQNGVLRFGGALTGNVQVTLPLPGYTIIENLTTGAFVLSFRAIGSGQVIATQQGSCRHVYNDGTNVRFVNLPDVGTYLDVAATVVPAWITACTIPPYLNCDGTTFSAATYPFLNNFLGGNTLPDSRGGSRATLNQGTGRITIAGSGIDGNTLGSIGGGQTQLLTLGQLPTNIQSNGQMSSAGTGLTFVGSTTGTGITSFSGTGGGSQVWKAFSNGTNAADHDVTVTGSVVSNNTAGQAHPIMGPTLIAGLTLIRAA